jgi:hypothetical protein
VAGLNHTSLKFSHSTVGEAIEITINFQATWDFVEGEILVLTMPRYTDGTAISLIDARDTNYDLSLSPSIQFEGAWMEGNYNNNVNPYSTSRLYLRVKKPLVKSTNLVEIKIYSDNGIKAYCGHPAFDDYKSINATAAGEAFILSSNIAGRPPHTMHQPLMGDACKANGHCYQRGSCDHCTGKCTCDEGWGAALDTVVRGRDVTSNCFSRKSSLCFSLSLSLSLCLSHIHLHTSTVVHMHSSFINTSTHTHKHNTHSTQPLTYTYTHIHNTTTSSLLPLTSSHPTSPPLYRHMSQRQGRHRYAHQWHGGTRRLRVF